MPIYGLRLSVRLSHPADHGVDCAEQTKLSRLRLHPAPHSISPQTMQQTDVLSTKVSHSRVLSAPGEHAYPVAVQPRLHHTTHSWPHACTRRACARLACRVPTPTGTSTSTSTPVTGTSHFICRTACARIVLSVSFLFLHERRAIAARRSAARTCRTLAAAHDPARAHLGGSRPRPTLCCRPMQRRASRRSLRPRAARTMRRSSSS
jgi:hypothetical protein